MKRFECACGILFKKQSDANEHAAQINDLYAMHGCGASHIIRKKSLFEMFLTALVSDTFFDLIYILSGVIVNYIIISNLDWSTTEKLIESFCVGLLLGKFRK